MCKDILIEIGQPTETYRKPPN